MVCGSVGDLNTHSGTSSRWRDAHNAFFVARGVPLLSGCQWDVAVESGSQPGPMRRPCPPAVGFAFDLKSPNVTI